MGVAIERWWPALAVATAALGGTGRARAQTTNTTAPTATASQPATGGEDWRGPAHRGRVLLIVMSSVTFTVGWLPLAAGYFKDESGSALRLAPVVGPWIAFEDPTEAGDVLGRIGYLIDGLAQDTAAVALMLAIALPDSAFRPEDTGTARRAARRDLAVVPLSSPRTVGLALAGTF